MAGIATFRLSSNSRLRPPRVVPLKLLHSPTRACVIPWLPTGSRFPRVYAISSNDIKVGVNIEVDGAPWRVLEGGPRLHAFAGKKTTGPAFAACGSCSSRFLLPPEGSSCCGHPVLLLVPEFLHVKPGKGAAFVRTKMRNYVTGNVVEKTFRAGSTINEASVTKETKQFTYKDGSQFVFMDLTTFEETRLNENEVGDKKKWLKEGMDCILLFWNGRVIDFEVPLTVKLTVIDVDPGLRGDTAQGGSKPATLETGAVVNVPLFISVGEVILVDTRTGLYTRRA